MERVVQSVQSEIKERQEAPCGVLRLLLVTAFKSLPCSGASDMDENHETIPVPGWSLIQSDVR